MVDLVQTHGGEVVIARRWSCIQSCVPLGCRVESHKHIKLGDTGIMAVKIFLDDRLRECDRAYIIVDNPVTSGLSLAEDEGVAQVGKVDAHGDRDGGSPMGACECHAIVDGVFVSGGGAVDDGGGKLGGRVAKLA